jgi:hypothetical protein
VAIGVDGLLALALDGRMGDSSVHAVRVQLGPGGKPGMGEDRVVWVGGSAERSTRLASLNVGPAPVAFLPMSKDMTGFGLVALVIQEGASEAGTWWLDYPNGLDPAPVAAASVCGRARVAFVRPERPEPGSPQILQLGEVTSDGRVVGMHTVATAQRIVHVALAAAPAGKPAKAEARGAAGAWLAYATDAGLAARPLVCSALADAGR